MSQNITSLPIEYQLLYGTARGNADVSDFVNNTSVSGVRGANGTFSQEELFGLFRSDPGAITVDSHNPLLVRLNRR